MPHIARCIVFLYAATCVCRCVHVCMLLPPIHMCMCVRRNVRQSNCHCVSEIMCSCCSACVWYCLWGFVCVRACESVCVCSRYTLKSTSAFM